MTDPLNEKILTLRLPSGMVGQIIDALCERMQTWRATERYLNDPDALTTELIEECSDPQEAKAIADCYQQIIEEIQSQRKAQTRR
ncbi:MAG: hypothetical protein IH624_04365 [Phycisphaerae bacterium]|nr:hypothetical protein [Phycisphaerae bacterium]